MAKASKKDLLTVLEENREYILHLFGKYEQFINLFKDIVNVINANAGLVNASSPTILIPLKFLIKMGILRCIIMITMRQFQVRSS